MALYKKVFHYVLLIGMVFCINLEAKKDKDKKTAKAKEVAPETLMEKRRFCRKQFNINMDSVLLVINFNYPFYENISYLEEIYSPAFPHIVFYGEKRHPKIITIDHKTGWYGQNVMSDVLERFPDYEGYLFIQDDCFINFWNLGTLDKDKVWYSEIQHALMIAAPSKGLERRSRFWWWDYSWKPIRQLLSSLDDKYLKMLAHNEGGKLYFIGHGWADFCYVPARLREDFLHVIKHLKKPVFQEVAVSVAFMAVEDIKNWEVMRSSWGKRQDPSAKHHWVHPIKFSSDDSRGLIDRILNKGVFVENFDMDRLDKIYKYHYEQEKLSCVQGLEDPERSDPISERVPRMKQDRQKL